MTPRQIETSNNNGNTACFMPNVQISLVPERTSPSPHSPKLWPHFNVREDVLSWDLGKVSKARDRVLIYSHRLKICSIAADVPVKFQSDWTTLNRNPAASKLARYCNKTSYQILKHGPCTLLFLHVLCFEDITICNFRYDPYGATGSLWRRPIYTCITFNRSFTLSVAKKLVFGFSTFPSHFTKNRKTEP